MTDIAKVEISGTSIEIDYVDGSKEEIEAGRYERKNTAGDTVEERPATSADRSRLEALAASSSATSQEFTLPDGTKVEIGPGDKIEVEYPDGTKEEIEAGRYEQKDSSGEKIVERPASASDSARLQAIADEASEGTGGGAGSGGTPGGSGDDDGTPDQGSGDAPGTPGSGTGGSGDDDGTPDQGSGDAPGTPGSGTGGSGDDDGTPDQGSGDIETVRTVALLYEAALDRAPQQAGLNFWIDRVEDGMELEDLADAFIDSFEFRSTSGPSESLSNRDFVETLFENVLDRGGASAGVAFWTGLLDGGLTREDCLIEFATSDENVANSPEIAGLMQNETGDWIF